MTALRAAAALEDEPQLALREGSALAPRVAPATAGAVPCCRQPGRGGWTRSSRDRSTGLSLIPNPDALEPLGPTEVRVAVRAAGLNFRDVLVALGYAVPGEAVIGGEGAGVVSRSAPR